MLLISSWSLNFHLVSFFPHPGEFLKHLLMSKYAGEKFKKINLIFISPSFLKDIFTVYIILGLQLLFFVFASLNIEKLLLHCPLASMVSDEKSIAIQIVVLTWIMYYFYWIAFKFFSLSLFFRSVIMIYMLRAILLELFQIGVL